MIEATEEPTGKCKKTCRSMLGLTLAFASAIFAAIMTLLVKFLQEAGADHLLLVRWFVQYFFMLPVLSWRREAYVKSRRTNITLFVASTTCAFASTALFFSLTMLPVGDAVAILSTYVPLVGFFACVFLKEPCRVSDVCFAVLALAGLVLVARPPFIFGSETQSPASTSGSRTLGIILATAAALLSAIAMVAIRKMGDKVHFSLFLFYFSLWGFVISIISILSTKELVLPCLDDILVMFLSAFAALLNAILVTLALQNGAAGPVTIVCTSEVVLVFVFEYFFLNVVPSVYSVIGAGLIMTSCIGLAALSIRESNKE